jgi:hypothetical protein
LPWGKISNVRDKNQDFDSGSKRSSNFRLYYNEVAIKTSLEQEKYQHD